MYWTNFCQPTIRVQQNIFVKNLSEFGILHLYASFGTFCVEIGQLFEAQWVFEHSQEFETGNMFLQKQGFADFQAFFKSSLWLE